MQRRFQRGDIVLAAPGYRQGCFAITGINPSRPTNCYDAIHVVTLKRYHLADANLGSKIGTATESFLSGDGQNQAPAGAEKFERGKKHAEQMVMLNVGLRKERWQMLANAKVGDQLRLNWQGRIELVTFQHVLEQGQKYVFTAANFRGKVYKWPLEVLIVTRPKRAEAEIIRDLQDVECQLSPENLTCDGELPRTEVAKRQANLLRQRGVLIQELGREPTQAELYPSLAHV